MVVDDSGYIYITGTTYDISIPSTYNLETTRPNPARAWTEIHYALPVNIRVSLSVYDVTGKLVRTLKAGYKTILWDGRDNWGRPVPNCLYFIRLATQDYKAMRKLVLMR